MKRLQKLFAAVITLLSVFIVVTVLYKSGEFSEYFEYFENLLGSAETVLAQSDGNYVSLDAIGEKIQDSELDALADSEIDGSDYSFDTTYYPYYGMLDTSEKAVYAQVYANAVALADSFVPVDKVSVSQVTDIMEAVYSDHPELFYLSTKYGYLYTSQDNCVQITLEYNSLINDVDSARASFESAADTIIEGASSLSSDYEKEKYVHDAIAEICTYNESASLSQSAYSALVGGSSVCAGYSRAFQYIMTELKIPTYFVAGTATGNHAWNMVKLDDGYYNVDLTWDDKDSGIIYNYFNISDADFADTHTRKNLSLNLPSCNGSAYSGLEAVADVEKTLDDNPMREDISDNGNADIPSIPTGNEQNESAPSIPSANNQEKNTSSSPETENQNNNAPSVPASDSRNSNTLDKQGTEPSPFSSTQKQNGTATPKNMLPSR